MTETRAKVAKVSDRMKTVAVSELRQGQIFTCPKEGLGNLYMITNMQLKTTAEGVNPEGYVVVAVVVAGKDPGVTKSLNKQTEVNALYLMNHGGVDASRKEPVTSLEQLKEHYKILDRQIKALEFHSKDLPIG